ncbi:hypothetical protein CANARDRAFT_10038 [[Candida] arabinofermentans NRRL YB-2248]|uniref:Protein kinase domain-containing protein n=1 Tax=[Candida] arabinofermentans NRRL YB-2248 TaxID=983967 RepID=A0A1E4STV4_9ASCO|nr:hypothetical protein CANARDRAFT_10038 [[Candida] arabinofermentans NRRL YB-2248]
MDDTTIDDDYDDTTNHDYSSLSLITDLTSLSINNNNADFLIPEPESTNYDSPNSIFSGDFFAGNNRVYTNDSVISTSSPITRKRLNSGKYEIKNKNNNNISDLILNKFEYGLKIGEYIGKGSNSYVYKITSSLFNGDGDGGDKYVVKIPISFNKCKYIEREVEILQKLNEYNKLNAYSFFTDDYNFPFLSNIALCYLNKLDFQMIKKTDDLLCLIMIEMEMDLVEFIKLENRSSCSCWFWKLCNCLIDGLTILKQLNIVHCDLKTSNILVNFKANDEPIFKIIDFSSSIMVGGRGNDVITEVPDMTLQFTAPELLNTTSNRIIPNYQTDLFSVGMILLHCITGKIPYDSVSYDQYYLIDQIKNMKIFESLSIEDLNKLKLNNVIFKLLKLILIERCDLNDVKLYIELNNV